MKGLGFRVLVIERDQVLHKILVWATVISLEPTLILIMRIVVDHINFQPMSNLQFKLSKGHISCFSSEIDVGDYFMLCKVWVGRPGVLGPQYFHPY